MDRFTPELVVTHPHLRKRAPGYLHAVRIRFIKTPVIRRAQRTPSKFLNQALDTGNSKDAVE